MFILKKIYFISLQIWISLRSISDTDWNYIWRATLLKFSIRSVEERPSDSIFEHGRARVRRGEPTSDWPPRRRLVIACRARCWWPAERQNKWTTKEDASADRGRLGRILAWTRPKCPIRPEAASEDSAGDSDLHHCTRANQRYPRRGNPIQWLDAIIDDSAEDSIEENYSQKLNKFGVTWLIKLRAHYSICSTKRTNTMRVCYLEMWSRSF